MRRLISISALILVLVVVVLVGRSLQDWLALNAVALQKEAQNALAGALRALRSGQPGAVTAFLTICFTHGFLHALGPGHGKAVIAAYAAASDSTLRRMSGIAALASLAQAAVAVLLVYGAVWLLDGARDHVEGFAAWIEPLSFAVVAALGVMLLWRGTRRFVRLSPPLQRTQADRGHEHDHNHEHDEHCGCGHAHAPEIATVGAATGWGEIAALILGIALRPCTSALFLLILTWRLDLDLIGIAGAFVMGLGTAMVTITAAVIAVLMRRGMVFALPAGRSSALILAGGELLIGALIAMAAGGVVLRLL